MDSIMFDLYGTLIIIHTDASPDLFWDSFALATAKYKAYDYLELKKEYLSICEVLQKEKEEIEILDVFEKLFTVSRETSCEIALIFRKLSTKYIKKYIGVDKLLTKLKENGHKIYLLSNAQNAFTIPEMKELDLIKYFDGIAISSDYGVKKPNKDFYLKAMKKFNLEAKNTWMIGNDYECDIKPAQELGLRTIFIKSNLTFSHCEKADIKKFSYRKLIKCFQI